MLVYGAKVAAWLTFTRCSGPAPSIRSDPCSARPPGRPRSRLVAPT